MKVRLGPTDTFFPIPAALVVSSNGDKTNVLTVAWIGIMGSTPPILGISLYKNRYSLTLIKESGEFSVNIPSASHFKEVDYCGLVSGKKSNKLDVIGLTPVKSAVISSPIIEECPYNLECKVHSTTYFGDWVAIFGEIVETHVDNDKVDTPSMKIDISKVNPLVYCSTIREYWSLGEKLGDGFSAGSVYKNLG